MMWRCGDKKNVLPLLARGSDNEKTSEEEEEQI